MRSKLRVLTNKQFSGVLSFEEGTYIYNYVSKNPKNFVSLTMPLRAKSWNSKNLHPIFEMHLPEGYLLSIIKKHFSKVRKTDDFGLLELLSENIKGRITYTDKQEIPTQVLHLDDLIERKDEKLFDELVSRFALHSPISGVQPKVLADLQNKATLQLEHYIVKSWGEDYPHLALNEYYCMSVLKEAAILVPEFHLSKDKKLFILKRFDIKADGNYLGFEDMCVLQAKQTTQKYEGSYEGVAKSIKLFVSSKHRKEALMQFFKMVVLNVLLQNGDAHLKNFGLIYEGIEDINLSPAYDVVTTTLYIRNDVPALTLHGRKKWSDKKTLLEFGINFCNLTPKEVKFLYQTCEEAKVTIMIEMQKALSKEKDKSAINTIKQMLQLWQ